MILNSLPLKFTSLIFDFNGVIIDDEGIHCDLFKKILAEEEIELTEEQYWQEYLGYDDKGLLEAIYQRDGLKLTPKKSKDLVAKKNQLYFPALKQNLKIFPGVVEFINQIKKSYQLAIVSGALRSEIDFVLQEAKIKNAFSVIVSAEDTKHGKPDPEGFVLALAHLKNINLKIRPENCLVIEDSLAGIESAHRAQMKVVALTHTYPQEELKEADFVVNQFEEIELILYSLKEGL